MLFTLLLTEVDSQPAAQLRTKFSSPSDVRRPPSGLSVCSPTTYFFSPTNLADPRFSLTSTSSSSTSASRLPGPKMSCRKRCKREIFKFAQYLFRLVTGTLNIGKRSCLGFGGKVCRGSSCRWIGLDLIDSRCTFDGLSRDRLAMIVPNCLSGVHS